jgi:hypothetical protein
MARLDPILKGLRRGKACDWKPNGTIARQSGFGLQLAVKQYSNS